jgi:hypothetical protein
VLEAEGAVVAAPPDPKPGSPVSPVYFLGPYTTIFWSKLAT